MVRCLLAFMVAPQYYDTLADLRPGLPQWTAPTQPETIRSFFETSASGLVPWRDWAGPLLVWTVFLLVLWAGLFCLLSLFQRRWSDQEHLRFPLLYLPLEMTAGASAVRASFFRNWLMWVGFGLGLWYAIPVVVSPIWPNFPDWRKTLFPLQSLNVAPWSDLSSIYIRPLPHLIGLGYLMSTDNLLSIWASFWAQRLAWVGAMAFGLRRPGWHIGVEHQQSSGAIAVLAVWLLWGNRQAFWAAWRDTGREAGPAAPLPPRVAAVGAVLGFGLALVWLRMIAIPYGWAAFFLLMSLGAGLVYARLRSETGLPSYWALPFLFEERNFLLDLLGSRFAARGAGLRALTSFSTLGWMTTGQFPQTGAYHIENLRLGRTAGVPAGRMLAWGLGAIAVGLVLAYWTHLSTFYRIGALSAVGAEGDGYYEVRWARGSYQELLSLTLGANQSGLGRNLFRLTGGAVVLLLASLRARFAQWPITPWGYLVASSYGHTYWGSFFFTWVAQKVILRYGGMRTHTRAVPFFLGLSFGYMAATVAAVTVGFLCGKPFSFAGGRRLYFDI
jgi:hypothetical protein